MTLFILLDKSLFYMTYFILHDIIDFLPVIFVILLGKSYFYLTEISLHITIVKRIIYMSESKSVING